MWTVYLTYVLGNKPTLPMKEWVWPDKYKFKLFKICVSPTEGSLGGQWLCYWCVPLCLCPVHSSHVVLWVCLPSCSKLPIHSVCHGLAQHTQRVAFVCSHPCPMSICYWDRLQCCHHPNQNKWTFVCCLLLNLTRYVTEKHGESKWQRAQLLHFCRGHT